MTRPARGRIPSSASDGDALAAARLAHDPERLAGRDVERDAVDGVDRAALRPELDAQVVDGRGAARSSDTAAELRVECLAQPVADQVEAEHGEHDREPGAIARNGALCR